MHNIGHLTYPKDTSQKIIVADVMDIASRDGDGHSGVIHFHPNIICDDLDSAIEKIRCLDNGWYDDHAVLYHDFGNVKPSAEMNKIYERIAAMRKKKAEYMRANRVNQHSSEFIGCKRCGSKIARHYINDNNRCPVCANNLSSPTVQNRIKKFDDDIAALETKYRQLKIKNKEKAPLCWCVKYEYHS